jgi:hypothetical protein
VDVPTGWLGSAATSVSCTHPLDDLTGGVFPVSLLRLVLLVDLHAGGFVLAITRPVYERVRNDPRQFVILPPHLISEIEDVVLGSDGFLIVAKRGERPEDIAVRTDPRR